MFPVPEGTAHALAPIAKEQPMTARSHTRTNRKRRQRTRRMLRELERRRDAAEAKRQKGRKK